MRRYDLSPIIFVCATSAVLGVIHLTLSILDVEPVLNMTISAPRGLYLVRHPGAALLVRGELVRLEVPTPFVPYVYGRKWLRAGTPLLKTVAGLPGDILCVVGGRFSVSGHDLGPVFTVDSQGLALPVIQGCRTVPAGHFVPVSTFHPKSFDGRYMGPVPMALVTGRARLLWTF